MIDLTITLGNILTALGMIIGGVIVFNGMRTTVSLLASRMDGMEKATQNIAQDLRALQVVVTENARLDERLNAQALRLNSLDQRVLDLSHGRGWVIEDFNQYGHIHKPEGGK